MTTTKEERSKLIEALRHPVYHVVRAIYGRSAADPRLGTHLFMLHPPDCREHFPDRGTCPFELAMAEGRIQENFPDHEPMLVVLTAGVLKAWKPRFQC